MNYRTNEDKLSSDCCNYNAIHNVEDITGSGDVTEPVTIQGAKDYMRQEGFSFDDDSPADEFDFDDDLVSDLIIEARMWCEQFTGVHLVPKTLQVVLTNGAGMIAIPGPVTSTIANVVIKDRDNNVQSGTVYWIGSLFPKLETQFAFRITLEYEAGYGTDCPSWAKNAIKAYVADHYEYRGDDAPPAANVRAAQKCRPHRRVKMFG